MKIQPSDFKRLGKKITRYGLFIPLSNVLLTHGSRFLPAKIVKNISRARHNAIQKKLLPYIPQELSVAGSQQLPSDKKIWVCWLQGEAQMPAVVRKCLASLRANANGHEVIVLTEENLKDYVVVAPHIYALYHQQIIKPAHFADILRVNLLAQQGGMWIDATILATAPIPAEWFDYDFYSIKTAPYSNHISQCRWAVFALSASKGSPLFVNLAKTIDNYLASNDTFLDYFMFDHLIDLLYQRDAAIRRAIDAVPFNNPNVHSLAKDPHFNPAAATDTYLYKLSTRK